MSQPTPYTPATDFSAEEANNVGGRSSVRTAQLDAEFAALEITVDALCANLALIQRDDGEIRDGKVKLHTLAADVKALLTTYDCTIRGAWLTATDYALKNVVTNGGVTYICAIAHTSGTFATDLAAGKWLALSSTLATDVSFTPQAGIVATNVSAALAELGNQVGDGSSSLGFRNRVINGDMRIDQRNAGGAVTINTAAYTYTLDRWAAFGDGVDGRFTVQRSAITPPAGFTHVLKVQVTTADASVGAGQAYTVKQPIEGFNLAELDWGLGMPQTKQLVLSFWVRSSVTGVHGLALRSPALTRTFVYTYFISAANTWEQKFVYVTPETTAGWTWDNSTGLEINFDLGSGSNFENATGWSTDDAFRTSGCVRLINTLNATWELTGVQLEVGTVPTPFERRPYGLELALCQRYYEVGPYAIASYGNITTGNTHYLTVPYAVTKRTSATPTLTHASSSGFAAINPTVGATYAHCFRADKVSNATQNVGYFEFTWVATAELP